MTRKMRIVVAFEVEVTEEFWLWSEQHPGYQRGSPAHPLLTEIATYLACRVENEPGDCYFLQDPTAYWPDDYARDYRDGKLDQSPDQPSETMDARVPVDRLGAG